MLEWEPGDFGIAVRAAPVLWRYERRHGQSLLATARQMFRYVAGNVVRCLRAWACSHFVNGVKR